MTETLSSKQRGEKNPRVPDKNEELSPELRGMLLDEAYAAEIKAAIDAAAEEGLIITPEEAIKIIISSTPKNKE